MKVKMISMGLTIACLSLVVTDTVLAQGTAEMPLDRAQWIWSEGDPLPQNFYLYSRKSVDLAPNCSSAEVHVTADSRYKLFVNGEYVGRGPARYDQRWQSYDTHNILPFLQEGENVISAIVHQYGVETHSYVLGRGGFLVQGEVVQKDGSRIPLDTDNSWRVLPAPTWDRNVPRASFAIMWMEIYDARKEPVGWMKPGFDDAGFTQMLQLFGDLPRSCKTIHAKRATDPHYSTAFLDCEILVVG